MTTLPPRISLALALHNHQPVGNFGWVLAEVFDTAYAPMIDALERHPGVRLSLHYTGPLLTWLIAERPEAVERLRSLVTRGQVEILGGGFYEPVLASLPERDRIGQLSRMADELESMFGERPRGAWLAERVWEPDLPTSLVASGYEWTILDDAHFRAAAIPEADLWGPYTTEDQGQLLRVFGTEQGLRYRIPFREVDEVIGYLREHATDAGDRVGMMGDDGEKFGGWPTTWEHCWGEGRWVERFFEAIEANADWLTTTTPSAWLADHPPIGRVYIPTGSYAEMGEWALPADESLVFSNLLHEAQEQRRPEARWLRGAFWRNFQVRYREINDLHKQMLRTSEAVAAMPDGPERALAIDHLYQGQSNDCYWHGLFGGIYISHMRLATYEHLIAAEDLAGSATDTLVAAELRDLDMDGVDEVRLADVGQVVTVDLDGGGGIGGWDIRAVRHALTAVMRRRPEAYHEVLREFEAAGTRVGGDGGGGAPASIHGVVRVKEPGLAARLVYDTYERRSGLVRALGHEVAAEDWAEARATDLGDTVDGAFDLVELSPGRLVTHRDGQDRRDRRGRDAHADARWGPAGSHPRDRTGAGAPRRGGARRAGRHRMVDDDAGWRRQPRRVVGGGGRAVAPRCRRIRHGPHDDRPGQRPHRAVRDDHDRCAGRGLVGTHRDDLEFREWLRAGLPGQRAAPLLAGAPGRGRALVADGRSRGRYDPGPRPGRVVSGIVSRP